jgi:hypothetical protein
MRRLTLLITLLVSSVLLLGCEREEKRRQWEAQRAKECLDKFCEGDIEPKRDMATEVALKLNGQWYIGPKEYFSGRHGAVFYWPSKTPETGRPDGAAYPEKGQPFYDVAIEIFLSSKPEQAVAESTWKLLQQEERLGHVLDKRKLRDGLDVWRTRSGGIEETWYVATHLKLPNGDPPAIACRGTAPEVARCTGGFMWQPDVAAGLRFRAVHGPDWPEIHQEIIKVLQQLRKA